MEPLGVWWRLEGMMKDLILMFPLCFKQYGTSFGVVGQDIPVEMIQAGEGCMEYSGFGIISTANVSLCEVENEVLPSLCCEWVTKPYQKPHVKLSSAGTCSCS